VVPEPGNPQALNRYSYALSNSLRYTDPTGHFTEEELRKYGIPDWMIEDWQRDRVWWGMISKAQLGDVLVVETIYGRAEGRFALYEMEQGVGLTLKQGREYTRVETWRHQGLRSLWRTIVDPQGTGEWWAVWHGPVWRGPTGSGPVSGPRVVAWHPELPDYLGMPRIAVQVTEMRVDAWHLLSEKRMEIAAIVLDLSTLAGAVLQYTPRGLARGWQSPISVDQALASFGVDLQRILQAVEPRPYPGIKYAY
jgi:hypothetical protein